MNASQMLPQKSTVRALVGYPCSGGERGELLSGFAHDSRRIRFTPSLHAGRSNKWGLLFLRTVHSIHSGTFCLNITHVSLS